MISRTSISEHGVARRLGDVVEFLDHLRRPVTESERNSGPYPYYGANGQQGTIDGFIFDEPLILLAEDGGYFGSSTRTIAYRVSGKTWVNNHAHVLRARGGVDLAYLCRVLEHYDVTPFVTGTTRAKLTKAGASEILVPIPPISVQRRLAEVLDRAAALRAKRRAALAQLDTLAQAIFLDMFGNSAKNAIDSECLPFAHLVRDFRYGTSNKSRAEGWPTLRIPNVVGGQIDLTDLKRVPVDTREFDRLKLVDGDVLFVRTNGNPDFVGRCAVYERAKVSKPVINSDFIYASYLIRARLLLDKVSPIFIREFMLSAEGRRGLRSRSKTSAGQFNLNIEGLGAVKVPVPGLTKQRHFADVVEGVERLKRTHRASLTQLDALFASLQHRAFRGEL